MFSKTLNESRLSNNILETSKKIKIIIFYVSKIFEKPNIKYLILNRNLINVRMNNLCSLDM